MLCRNRNARDERYVRRDRFVGRQRQALGKGIILNGVVTQSNPCFGVRIKFSDLETNERESLRQFLKFVESTTRGYKAENGYLAQLKR